MYLKHVILITCIEDGGGDGITNEDKDRRTRSVLVEYAEEEVDTSPDR